MILYRTKHYSPSENCRVWWVAILKRYQDIEHALIGHAFPIILECLIAFGLVLCGWMKDQSGDIADTEFDGSCFICSKAVEPLGLELD